MLNVGLNIRRFLANCIHFQLRCAKKGGLKIKEPTLQKLLVHELQIGGLWLFSDLQWRKLVPTAANINEAENVFALMSQIITAKNFIICPNLRTVTRRVLDGAPAAIIPSR